MEWEMRAPDAKDTHLLQLLKADSRTPLKTLGAAVGLSTSAVQERLQRLKREGVIEAFTIRVGPEPQSAHAYMLVTTEARQCADVAPLIAHIGEITRCDSVAGEIDMVLTLDAPSTSRLQEIRDEIAAVLGVRSVVTLPRLVERFFR
jgi:Lrp/AsnC family transcriptional regulator for asnA, asnC and gidA